MNTTVAQPVQARRTAPTAPPVVDHVLRGAFAALALLSVGALPWAAARLPDGAARVELLLWTGALALLATIPVSLIFARTDAAAGVPAQLHARIALLLGVALSAAVALVTSFEFHGWPQFPDTFAELFHARALADGELWRAAPERPELVQIANAVIDGGRWYSQYPIGNVALLALGLATAAWLPPLLVAAALAWGTWRVAQHVAGNGAAVAALALAVASPMLVLSSAALMSQATTAALAVCALACVLRPAARVRDLLGAGALTGLAVSVRPLDGVILGAAIGSYVLLTRPGPERWRHTAVLALAGFAGVAPLLAANAATTGHPLRLGYNVLWGGGNLPGFGTRGWGIEFGVLDALRNLAFDVATLNLALLEWPVPVLILVAAATWFLPRPLSAGWRLLLGYTLLQVAVYFLYWHHDFFFGPRFLLPVVPVLFVLLGAGAVSAARTFRSALARHARSFLLAQAILAALLVALPRYANARAGISEGARIADAAAHATLPAPAVVLINDGFGARLFAQMWALGVRAPVAEQLYAGADACALHGTLARVRVQRLSGRAAEDALRAALAGASSGTPLGRAPAPSLRLPAVLPQDCAAQLAFDERSYGLQYAPLLWRNRDAARVRYLRDPGPAAELPATAAAVFRAHPLNTDDGFSVRFSMIRPAGTEGGAQ